jgi:membrane protein
MIKKSFRKLKKFTVFEILIESVKDFGRNDSMTFAASTAFYTIFSLPGLLIIVMSIAAAFYNEAEVRDEMLEQITQVLGSDSAQTFDSIIRNARIDETSLVAKFTGIAVLVFSATTVFVSLQNSINHIWHIQPKPERGLVKFVVNRLLSFSMVASIGFVLLVSLIIDAFIVIFFRYLSAFFDEAIAWLASITNFILSEAIFLVIFGLMYKILPDAKVKWKTVWLGAFVTMLLFGLGKFLLSLYMANTDVGSAYGTAGSLVFVLIWIYYSVVIFLFGAQITYYIAEKIGGGVRPNKEAVRVRLMEVDPDTQKPIKSADESDQAQPGKKKGG